MNYSTIDVIRAFTQEDKNFSTAIAVIKASIVTFGYDKVVNCIYDNDRYIVYFKCGVPISFTPKQLEYCIKIVNLQLNTVDPGKYAIYKEVYDYAHLLLTAMVINLMQSDLCQHKTIDYALHLLDKEIKKTAVPSLLGLGSYIVGKKPLQQFFMSPTKKGMIGWFYNHAVFISEEVYDGNGKVKHFVNRYPFRMQLVGFKVGEK